MKYYFIGGLIILFVFFIIFYCWRYLSKSYKLPCPFWLSFLVELDNPLTKSNHADVIIENSNILPKQTVTDYGCGPGRLTIPLAKKVGPEGQVNAIDIQAEMLTKVAQKAANYNLNNINYLEGQLGNGDSEYPLCDRAFLITVLGEIQNKKAALQQIFDTIHNGGTLTIAETVFDPHFQSYEKVLKLAKQVGFIEQHYFGNRFSYLIILQKQ